MPQIITNSMPIGSAGDLSRDVRECTIEAYHNSLTVPVTGFGLPVKAGAQTNSVTGLAGGEAASAILGFSVREMPAYPGAFANQAAGAGTPVTGNAIGILKKGYMIVLVGAGTPAKEGLVYVRVAAAAAGKPIGGVEAAADSTNTIIVANAQFMGGADASGYAEIRYNV